MQTILKISLVVLLILIIIVIWVWTNLNITRYFRLQNCDIHELDDNYKNINLIDGTRTVISFSSIPERLEFMKPTICSILTQDVRVHEIAINIPYTSRKKIPYVIPIWMANLKSLTIYRVEKDEGPATKLLPTLRRENKDTRIIVIDDDNVYNRSMVKDLVHYYEKSRETWNIEKKAAITNYGVKLSCRGDLPSMLTRGKYFINSRKEVDLLQGFSGFLVTPSMFPPQAYEITDCPKECISVDDWVVYSMINRG